MSHSKLSVVCAGRLVNIHILKQTDNEKYQIESSDYTAEGITYDSSRSKRHSYNSNWIVILIRTLFYAWLTLTCIWQLTWSLFSILCGIFVNRTEQNRTQQTIYILFKHIQLIAIIVQKRYIYTSFRVVV